MKLKTVPLRYVSEINPSVSFDEFEEDSELTFLPMDRVKSGYFIPNSEKFAKCAASYTAFQDGDIIMAKVTPCFENGNIAVAENLVSGKGFGSSELFVIRAQAIEPKFLFYCLQSSHFKQEGMASMTGAGGLKRVAPEVLRRHQIPVFEKETQRRVAAYLDAETQQIDALVAEKERMLALLEEKRAAQISHAVTRGLNPRAPLKPSALPWLGDIPKNWDVRRLKFLVSGIDQGSSPQCFNYPAEPGGIGVLKTGCVNGGVFRENENKALPPEIEIEYMDEVHEGDVLMSRASGSVNLIGSVALVEQKPSATLLLSDKTYRLRPNGCTMDSRFLVFIMGADVLRHQIKAYISGADGLANNIAKSDIMELLLTLPPLTEQRAIVAHLTAERDRTAELETTLRRSLTLLHERRRALITAAVTGQITI